MPQAGRLGDQGQVPSDSHGCPSCAHSCIGPATSGSGDVMVNGKNALRIDDVGVHSSCCGANTWIATAGAPGVFINGRKAHRLGDAQKHCGGNGKLVEGSPNVIIGDYNAGGPVQYVPLFEGGFTVLDPEGEPWPHVLYVITSPSGKRWEGRTDADGHTQLVTSFLEEDLELELFPDGPCGS